MTINGIAVATAAGQSAATVAANINAAVGLGPTGAVTASVAPSGALVLTSNTKGSLGTVILGPAVGSAYADFGFVAGTTSGVDDPVSLSTGQLKGLVDSRDILVQGQITSTNALASRFIEAVNSVHASGVGLDGKGGINFFSATSTNATNIALNATLTAAGGTDHIAAARMVVDATAVSGFSSAVGDSSNAIAMEGIQNQISQRLASTPVVAGQLVPGALFGPSTVLGVDLSGAAVTTTYTFTAVAGAPPTVSVNDGTKTTQATITVGIDGAIPPNSIITVDTGVGRLTLSAPFGTTTSAALVGLNGPPNAFVTTQPAPATIGNQYASQVAALGVLSRTATSDSANQLLLVSHLNTQRQQVSGVSLDEETINLIMYQKAYQASARVVTVVDGMLDTLINHMKL
jgi:flagellar hook-associated protein 1 FlgK